MHDTLAALVAEHSQVVAGVGSHAIYNVACAMFGNLLNQKLLVTWDASVPCSDTCVVAILMPAEQSLRHLLQQTVHSIGCLCTVLSVSHALGSPVGIGELARH